MRVLASFYRDRSRQKRDFRHLWIVRINAASQGSGISYNKLVQDLYQNQVLLNRKMFAQMAILNNDCFFTIMKRTNK
jgi:large subunit ribosomal protein L20